MYDVPTQKSVKADRVAVLRELAVHEVVLMVEPLWAGPWQPYMPPAALCGRTYRIQSGTDCKVVWAFSPRPKLRYMSAVQSYLENARTNIHERGNDPDSVPAGLEWVVGTDKRMYMPTGAPWDSVEWFTRHMRRWLTGKYELPFGVADFWNEYPHDRMSTCHRVVRAWSSRTTNQPIGRTQKLAGKLMKPGDVMCLAAFGQDGVVEQRSSTTWARKEYDVEDSMECALNWALASGATAVRYWSLQDFVGDDGELTRAGVWLRGKCRRVRGL